MQTARILPSSSGETALARVEAYASARWAFAQAARRGPMHTCDLRLAGHHVRLQVARRTLFERLRPAIGHLETQPAQPRIDLTINVWDAAETGVPLPAFAAWHGAPGDERVEASGDGRLIVHAGERFTGWLNRESQQMYVCFPSAGRATLIDRAKPLHDLLAIWHLDRRVPLVHASVIARHGAGLMLAGHGESGASTATLTCAFAGFGCLGDDTIGIEAMPDGRVRAHSVYCSAMLELDRLHWFPSLVPHAITERAASDEPRMVFLNRLLPRPVEQMATLAAIVIPRPNGRHAPRLTPVSSVEAHAALMPTTAFASPVWSARHAGLVADAIGRLPCYALDMPPGATAVPGCLRALLDSYAAS